MKLIKEIFKYRELLKNNVKKEVRGRYKNSILGVMWTFLNPLLQIAVYAMIFPYILKQQQPYYLIFVCVGLIPWSFFTTTIIQSTNTIIGNANIVKKVYFPREICSVKWCNKLFNSDNNNSCILYRWRKGNYMAYNNIPNNIVITNDITTCNIICFISSYSIY